MAWLPGGGYVIAAKKSKSAQALYVWKPEERYLRPLSSEGLRFPVFCDPRVERCLARIDREPWKLYAIDGSQPINVKGIASTDTPLNFTADGRSLWVAEEAETGAVRVSRVDWSSSKREFWKEIRPPQSTRTRPDMVAMTPDGQSYVYPWLELRSELYHVEGLR
jgi:hypothetical protein